MLTAMKLANGYAPRNGPQGMTVPLQFTAANNGVIAFDLFKEQAANDIEFIQSVWVENQDNPNPIEIQFLGTNQVVKVPANTQGMYPALTPSPVKIVCTTTAPDGGDTIDMKIILLNMPMPYYGSFSAL